MHREEHMMISIGPGAMAAPKWWRPAEQPTPRPLGKSAPRRVMAQRVACLVDGCARGGKKVRGYCPLHYQRWWRHGDATYRKPTWERCTIDGCEKKPAWRTSPLCEMHYARQRRNGDPEKLVERSGRRVTSHGYVQLRCDGHALAHKTGWAFEQRLVLYAKIGPGAHPCHWCGTRVTWDARYPARIDALVADHVDGDKLNNAPENLMPSCNPCNTKWSQRSQWLESTQAPAEAGEAELDAALAENVRFFQAAALLDRAKGASHEPHQEDRPR